VNGRAERVLAFIRVYKAERGMAPTYREIGAACGITTTSLVRYWLDKLERDGHLKRYRNVPRGIVLSESIPDSA